MRNQERRVSKRLTLTMEELKLEMAALEDEQSRLRDGQNEVKQKFQKITSECAQLREETNLLLQQNPGTLRRLLFQQTAGIKLP